MSQSFDIQTDAETSAGSLLVRSIAHQLNAQDLDNITATQREALSRFEKTNEMLTNCNTLSMTRLAAAMKEMQPYRQMLTEMKRDLDAIFRRIRIYKQSFSQLYPEAFTAAQQLVTPHIAADDDEEESKPPTADVKSPEASENSKPKDADEKIA